MNARADIIKHKSAKSVEEHLAGHGCTGVARGGVSRIKHLNKKIIKLLSFDADAVFKSKEWPYY